MKKIALLVSISGLAFTPLGAALADPFARYIQRSDTISLSGGDAKEVNATTHIIDPWPRHVGNRRIPGNGERMSGAVERYRDVSKLPQAPRPIVQGGGGGGPAAGGGYGGPGAGGGGAPMGATPGGGAAAR